MPQVTEHIANPDQIAVEANITLPDGTRTTRWHIEQQDGEIIEVTVTHDPFANKRDRDTWSYAILEWENYPDSDDGDWTGRAITRAELKENGYRIPSPLYS